MVFDRSLENAVEYGRACQNETIKRVTVVMPPLLHKQLKLLGIQQDITMNALILQAVNNLLSEYGSESSTTDDD
jgi:predicted HicB family RNase H-like nuclease